MPSYAFLRWIVLLQLVQSAHLEVCRLPLGVSPFAVCEARICYSDSREDNLSKCKRRTKLAVDSLSVLSLEYSSFTLGSARITGSNTKPSSLSHQHGLLSGLPDNLCQFPQLVKLDLSHNALSNLDGLWCLAQLDTLRLSYNLLTWLDNATFAGLARLRELHLDHNNIAHLGLSTLNLATPFLQQINVSGNLLLSFDVSNWDLLSPFDMHLSHNAMTKLTNNASLSVGRFEGKGPGVAVFQYNNFTEFMNWTELNIGNVTNLATLLEWGFDFRSNPWTCDCYMYSYLNIIQRASETLDEDYFYVKCQNPPEVSGQYAKDIDTSILKCNITESCPLDACLCYFQTSVLQTFVQCANSLLTLLPEVLPNFLHNGAISLDLSGSPITELLARPYLPFVVELNLSHTAITTFPEEIVPLLNPDVKIDLTGTPLRSLPPSLLAKVPARNLNVSLTSLECHCNLTFVETWLAQVGRNLSSTQCWQQGRRRGAEEVVQECRRPDNTLVVVGVSVGSVAAVVLLLTGLSYVFRYELAVLAHRLLYGSRVACLFKRNAVHVDRIHDVYISCADDFLSECLRMLWPRLTKRGLTVFIPEIHILPGEITREAQEGAISRARHVVVVVTAGYVADKAKQEECLEVCQAAFQRWDVELVVVRNRDVPVNCRNKFLRAVVRLGMFSSDVSAEGVVQSLRRKGCFRDGAPQRRVRYVVIDDVIEDDER